MMDAFLEEAESVPSVVFPWREHNSLVSAVLSAVCISRVFDFIILNPFREVLLYCNVYQILGTIFSHYILKDCHC